MKNPWLLPMPTLIVVGFLLSGAAFFVQVSVDRDYICQLTGSRHGGREWRFGFVTHKWYWASPVERFFKEEQNSVIHRWVSYRGDGHNIYGTRLSMGHGRPGAIIHLAPEHFDLCFAKMTREQKKALCDFLSSGPTDVTSLYKALDPEFIVTAPE